MSREAEKEKKRKMKKERVKEIDEQSIASISTVSSAQRLVEPPRLSQIEEKEARKYERLLREISMIEERIASGEKVDALQVQKAQRRAEIEATLVMRKLRAGHLRADA